MNQPFMSEANQTAGLSSASNLASNLAPNLARLVWQLPARDAVTLAADNAPRALWVHEGRVWLTRQCRACTPEDVWLQAGQSHTLPAGSEWVVEAWPTARVTLAQTAPALVKRRAAASWGLAWRAAAHLGRAWA